MLKFYFFVFNLIFILSIDIYISDHGSLTNPKGTLIEPYNNLIEGFALSMKNLDVSINEINFLILKDFTTVLTDDILNQKTNLEIVKQYYHLFNYKYNKGIIRVLPNACQTFLQNLNLENCPFYTRISVKTEIFSFNILSNFTIANIIFIGNDINLVYNNLLDSQCYNTVNGCCTDEKLMNILDSRCGIYNKTMTRDSISSGNQIFFKLNNSNITFSMINVQINYFNSIGNTTFFSLFFSVNNNFFNNIFIMKNVSFSNFYFFNGLFLFPSGSFSSILITNTLFENDNKFLLRENNTNDYSTLIFVFRLMDIHDFKMINSTFNFHRSCFIITNSEIYIYNITFSNFINKPVDKIKQNLFIVKKGLIFDSINSNITINNFNIFNFEITSNVNLRKLIQSSSNFNCTINKANFTNNSLITNFIYNDVTTKFNLIINDLIFTNNKFLISDDWEIGFFLRFKFQGSVFINNSVFKDIFTVLKSTTIQGGGLIDFNSNSNLTMNFCDFKNIEIFSQQTTSQIYGGVIGYFTINIINITSCIFQNIFSNSSLIGMILVSKSLILKNIVLSINLQNNYFSEIYSPGQNGMLFYIKEENFIFNHCKIANIIVPSQNILIYNEVSDAKLIFYSTIFKNITLELEAILFKATYQIIFEFYDCKFTKIKGNIFYLNGSNLIMNNTDFTELTQSYNIMKYSTIYFDKLFFNKISTLETSQSLFECKGNNIRLYNSMIIEVTSNGLQQKGNFMNLDESSIEITNCLFFNNSNIQGNGGILYCVSKTIIKIISCYFYNSSVQSNYGGIIYLDEANDLSISEIFIEKGISVKGAFFLNFNNYFKCENIVIKDLISENGGFIYSNLMSTLILNNIIISYTISSISGGNFYLEQLNFFLLKNMTIIHPNSQRGGVFQIKKLNDIYLELINIYKTSAEVTAGFVNLEDSNFLTIYKLNATSSTSKQEAGFILFKIRNTIILRDIIINKTSSPNGGTIQGQEYNKIYVENLILNQSNAESGGVFLFYTNNFISINNFKINQTNSSTYGGFIYISSFNTFLINNLTCNSSFSKVKGGFLFANDFNKIPMFNLSVLDVKTEIQNGGFLCYMSQNLVLLYDTVVMNTFSGNSGGLFYQFYGNILYMYNVKIKRSEASLENGGLIFSTYYNYININYCFFNEIFAWSNGGAFSAFLQNRIYVYNSIFFSISNKQGNGGFLEMENQNYFYSVSIIIENVINVGGEGIFVYSTYSNVFSTYLSQFNSLNENSEGIAFYSNAYSNFLFEKTILNINFCDFTFLFLSKSNLTLNYFNFKESSSTNTFISLNDSYLETNVLKITAIIFKNLVPAFNSIIKMKYFKIRITLALKNNLKFFFQLTNCSGLFTNGIIGGKYLEINIFNSDNSDLSFFKLTIFGIKNKNSGSVFFINSPIIVKINKCVFIENSCFFRGGVVFTNENINKQKGIIQIKKNIFLLNKAKDNGGVGYFNNSLKNEIIRNINIKNQGKNGGVYSFNQIKEITIKHSIFIKNKAKIIQSNIIDERSKGGVFISNKSLIYLINLKLITNEAEIGGIFYRDLLSDITTKNLTLILNKAKYYGDNFATEIKSVSTIYEYDTKPQQLRKLSFKSIVSGKQYSDCLGYIIGIDDYNSIGYMSETSTWQSFIKINEKNSPKNPSNLIKISNSMGFICLNGPFRRNSIPIPLNFYYEINFKNKFVSNLDILFRNCKIGERLDDSNSCIECGVGEYSFVENFTDISPPCLICTDETNFNCFGGSLLTPKKDYWRLNKNSFNFLKCNSQACLGDPRNLSLGVYNFEDEYASGKCAQGFQGILCDTCIKGYGKPDMKTCEDCNSSQFAFTILIQLTLRVLITLFSIYYAISMSRLIVKDTKSSYTNLSVDGTISSNILKIFINHIQVLAILLILPLKLPNSWHYSMSIFFSLSPSISDSLSLDCILNYFNSNLPSLYFKIVLTLIYPFVLLIICIFLLLIFHIYKRLKKTDNHRDIPLIWYTFSLALAIFLLCYSDVVKVLLEMLEYSNVGDSNNIEFRVVKDREIKFDSPDHQYYVKTLDLPFILVIGIILPMIILIYLTKNYFQNNMENKWIRFNFGFYFYAYKKNFFFWEFVILFRKIIIIFIQLYLLSRSNNKDLYPLTLMLTILLIALFLQVYFEPFQLERFNSINKIEKTSLVSLFFSFFFVIFYQSKSLLLESVPLYYTVIFGILGILINSVFFIQFAFMYYKHSIAIKVEKIQFTIQKMKSSIKSPKNSATLKSRNSKNSPEYKSDFFDKESSPSIASEPKSNKSAYEPKSNKSEKKDRNSEDFTSYVQKQAKNENNGEKQTQYEKPEFTINLKKDETDRKRKEKKIQARLRRNTLKKFIERNAVGYDIANLMERNKKIAEKYNSKCEITDFYYEKEDIINEKDKYTYEFMEEDFEYIICSISPKGIYSENDYFTISTEMSYFGKKQGMIFLKLQLKYQNHKKDLSVFEFKILKHAKNLICIENPEKSQHSHSQHDSKREKIIELYFYAVNPIFIPPIGYIETDDGDHKFFIKFKLPIIMNAFITPINLRDFKELHEKMEKMIIIEDTFSDLKSEYFNNMNDLTDFLKFSDIMNKNELGGLINWINDGDMIFAYYLHFLIEETEKKEKITHLLIKVGYHSLFNELKDKIMNEISYGLIGFFKKIFHSYEEHLMQNRALPKITFKKKIIPI